MLNLLLHFISSTWCCLDPKHEGSSNTPGDQPQVTPTGRGDASQWEFSRSFLEAQNARNRYSHSLLRRDACSQAFGDGWGDSQCTPGNTLCCVNEGQAYPQCQQYLGLGWCCTEYEQGCYVDLSTSSCGQPGAVQCTQLAAGVDEACCPQYTTCAPGYNASTTYVRCNIRQTAIQALAQSTTSLAGATAQTQTASQVLDVATSTASTSTLTTSTGSSQTPSTSSSLTSSSMQTSVPASSTSISSSSATSSAASTPTTSTLKATTTYLSAGDIAGIAIGPVVAVGLLLGIAWALWRRRSKKRIHLTHGAPTENTHEAKSPYRLAEGYGIGGHESQFSRAELAAHGPEKLELASGQTSPREIHTSRAVHAGSPMELDSHAIGIPQSLH